MVYKLIHTGIVIVACFFIYHLTLETEKANLAVLNNTIKINEVEKRTKTSVNYLLKRQEKIVRVITK